MKEVVRLRNKRKWVYGILLALTTTAFLVLEGLAASPGSAGITFVEDESQSSSSTAPGQSPGSTSPGRTPSPDRDRSERDRDHPPDNSGSRDTDKRGEAKDAPETVSIFDPRLPLTSLGALPKTGSENLSRSLAILGGVCVVQALGLLTYGSLRRKPMLLDK